MGDGVSVLNTSKCEHASEVRQGSVVGLCENQWIEIPQFIEHVIASICPRKGRFEPRSVHVLFLANKVLLGLISPVIIISPVLYSPYFIVHRHITIVF
jgi:hypothetical protein